MTATAQRAGHAVFERRPFAVFASAGDEERRRRLADVATLGLGALLIVAGSRQHTDPTPWGESFALFLRSLPDWSKTLLGAAFALASVYAFFVLVSAIVARDRPGLIRDLLVAGIVTLAVGFAVGWVVTGDWPSYQSVFNSARPHFPVLRVALVTAIATTAAPHLIRPVRRLGRAAIVGAALAAVALELGEVAGVIVAFGTGLAVAAIVHFVWGSPAGAPSLFRVRSALWRLGIVAGEFTPVPSERGLVMLACTDANGRALEVKVYGADAADAQLAAKAWRFLWYRRGGASLTVTRTQQVEHEALVTLLVQRAGVTTAELVATGSTASGDKLLITEPVADVGPLGEEHLEPMWAQLDRLIGARISHGSIDGAHVHATAGGEVAISDWSTATVEAAEERIARDIAAALALSASVAGADRAVELAMAHVGESNLVAALSCVQNAAFSSDLRRTLKKAKVNLESLRDAAATASGEPVPKLVKLERVKWSSLLMMVVLAAAVWFVIGQIAEIGWDTLVDSFQGAAWGWLLVALVVGQLPRVADAISVLGACDQPLPFGPTVGLEMSISFINLAIPSTAARVALSVRYFQKQGVAAAKAVTFGALDSVSLFITQLGILIVTVGFGLTSLDFNLNSGEGDVSAAAKLMVLALIAIVVGIIVVLAVRRLREWTFHQLAQGRDALKGIGSVHRWGPLFGGNLLSQILFSTTLGICVLAFGYHVSLVNLMAINVLVSFFAGLMPIPGGIGVTEAALTAGLVAAGVPQAAALSAVLAYRVFTYYLPPVWGFFALQWLRRHDYM